MEQDQHCHGRNRTNATRIQSRSKFSQHHSIIGNTHDPENQQDHDRAQSSQCSAELEHVPSHGSTRSMHTGEKKTEEPHFNLAPKDCFFTLFAAITEALHYDNTVAEPRESLISSRKGRRRFACVVGLLCGHHSGLTVGEFRGLWRI